MEKTTFEIREQEPALVSVCVYRFNVADPTGSVYSSFRLFLLPFLIYNREQRVSMSGPRLCFFPG